MPERTVSLRDRTITYDFADADTSASGVLFVHGACGSRQLWAGQRRLHTDRPIAALDLGGHGRSEPVDADPGWETLSAHADEVLSVREHTGAEFLVGHSLGAAIVLHLLTERSLDLEGAVLMGTGTRLPMNAEVLRLAVEDVAGLIEFLHAPDRLFYDPTSEMIAASKHAMASCDRTVIQRDILTADTVDFRDSVAGIEVPVLVLGGREDRLIPPSLHVELAEALPESVPVTIEHTAHLPMVERPERTNELLAAFFDDPDLSTSA